MVDWGPLGAGLGQAGMPENWPGPAKWAPGPAKPGMMTARERTVARMIRLRRGLGGRVGGETASDAGKPHGK